MNNLSFRIKYKSNLKITCSVKAIYVHFLMVGSLPHLLVEILENLAFIVFNILM